MFNAKTQISIFAGYKEKWIKCASRYFALEYLGYGQSESEQNPSETNIKIPSKKDGGYVDRQIKSAQDMLSKLRRVKRSRKLVNPTIDLTQKYYEIKDNLSERDKRGCKGIERKIKKNCADVTKYSCVLMNAVLTTRQQRIAELSGSLPGKILFTLFM